MLSGLSSWICGDCEFYVNKEISEGENWFSWEWMSGRVEFPGKLQYQCKQSNDSLMAIKTWFYDRRAHQKILVNLCNTLYCENSFVIHSSIYLISCWFVHQPTSWMLHRICSDIGKNHVPGWLCGFETEADDGRRCSSTSCQAAGDGRLSGLESGNYEGNNFDWDKNILVGAPSAGSTRFGFLVESDFQLEDKSTPPIVVNFKERTFGGAGTCDAWYKNSEGYNWTLWPSDCITYWSVFQLYITRNLTKLNHRPCRVRPSDATFFW